MSSASVQPRDQLVCNARDCFQKIDHIAWITRCSHVFCEQHGQDVKLRQAVSTSCPACGARIHDDFGIVERSLSDSVHSRALLLCGYSPDIIMEIANSAITFWNFQKQQVCVNLERKVQYYKETLSKFKQDMALAKNDAELKIHRLEQQLESCLARNKELSETPGRETRGEHHRKAEQQARKRKMDDFLL
ncbi:E3 ubiquitin-protein ligase CCNB1IP1-like [Sabethes cyaneus]|uniref:E3 ubiquitin-protein ligase CCNB1IP1-like n=1 Tax=Sabethes cyaneus TaxID=53552 RepID=UPI00237E4E55|nr:E3 ubiquitin-protein ligase CCNB1IP1-like [Sabethes cyaneus]